jgi:outer membrane protein
MRKSNEHWITKAKSWMLVVLFGLTTLLANAQQPVQLTLKDALKYALEANQNARKAKLDVENSQYKIDEVRARALPQVSASGGVTYNPILQLSSIPGEMFGGAPGSTTLVAFGQKWNSNAALSLSQTLFDQSVFTGIKAAATTAEFYKLNQQLTEEQVLEQVATNYYRLLVQRHQVQVVDSTIHNTEKVKNVLQSLLDNGLAKKIDVDRMNVNISNLQSNRQRMLNDVTLLENQLKFLIGMPIQTAVVVPDVDMASIKPIAVPKEDSVDLSNRTELAVLNTQQDLLQYQKQATKAEYYPSLSLSGAYSYQGTGNKFPILQGKSNGVNWFDVASVGLNLRIPIFNGGATKARLKQNEVSIQKLNEDIASTRLSLNLAHENARTQINNSIITLNAQKQNVALADEVYSNTQNNYNNGLATLTDLLNAETSLTEANNNYSSALLNYRVAEIQLIKSQGNLKSLID